MPRDRWTLLATGFAAMFLVAGILHFSVRSAAADQIGFAVDNTENLFSVDLTTATATPIGFTGQFLQGLAFSPGGSRTVEAMVRSSQYWPPVLPTKVPAPLLLMVNSFPRGSRA